MRLLIDSHTLVWWLEASSRLGIAARDAIGDRETEVLVSVAALWELTLKSASRKLTLPADLETMVHGEGFSVLSITFDHLRRFGALPQHHRDPFDRMMIAQALVEAIPLASVDQVFRSYGVPIVW